MGRAATWLTPAPWEERLVDLRVDENPEPLKELRRLLTIHQAYSHAEAASKTFQDMARDDKKFESANDQYQKAILIPEMAGNPELLFWYAMDLVTAERVEDALPLFKQVFDINPQWRDLVPRLLESGSMTIDPELIEQILNVT